MRSASYFLLSLFILSACRTDRAPIEAGTHTPGESEAEARLLVSPESVSFYTQDTGSTESRVLSLVNIGNTEIFFTEVRFDDYAPSLSFTNLAGIELDVGESTDLILTWTPEAGESIDGSIWLFTSDRDLQSVEIPVTGETEEGELVLSPDPLDLGEVGVGCTEHEPVTLINNGLQSLTVSSVEIDESEGWSLGLWPGTNGSLPWTMEPGDEINIRVNFTPVRALNSATELQVQVEGSASEATLWAHGDGWVEDEVSDRFTTRSELAMDLVFVVDTSCSMIDEVASFGRNFDALTQALDERSVDWRVSGIAAEHGCVLSDGLFIDSTHSDDEVNALLSQMLGYADIGGTASERTLGLLMGALQQMGSGQCNQGLLREEAQLNLLAMTDEEDKSPHSYTEYVDFYQSLKDEPSDVIFHAIGGDMPYGCGTAQPFMAGYDASVATGGSFHSICDDMAGNLASLGEELGTSRTGSQIYTLSDVPAIDTLAIRLDGQVIETWTYDESTNAIVLDNETSADLDLLVEYTVQAECD